MAALYGGAILLELLCGNLREKLDHLKARTTGGPNPFVVGQANYQKFLDVMSQCMDAQIARPKE